MNQHTCACGTVFTTTAGWNNYNAVLRCEACEERQQNLLAEIAQALQGKRVETIYVATDLRHLVSINNIPSVEIIYRRRERIGGDDFQIEA